ncbi:Hypothetical predicted protein [Podarcis lilfordi]|uniref:Uncharacterized protein n=1 Tax=Podarcis lilfordi TaxID=74358 RepID=A0AA35PDK6_9SAUR|nr:Hypothetical predicted protein [Podarcis lilfordi]
MIGQAELNIAFSQSLSADSSAAPPSYLLRFAPPSSNHFRTRIGPSPPARPRCHGSEQSENTGKEELNIQHKLII